MSALELNVGAIKALVELARSGDSEALESLKRMKKEGVLKDYLAMVPSLKQIYEDL
jgi:hypothetical protein